MYLMSSSNIVPRWHGGKRLIGRRDSGAVRLALLKFKAESFKFVSGESAA
jgi:hypothetical protein